MTRPVWRSRFGRSLSEGAAGFMPTTAAHRERDGTLCVRLPGQAPPA